jgi:hypothetical protein
MQFGDNLFLYDDGDLIRVKSTMQFRGYEAQLELQPDRINEIENSKRIRSVMIVKDSSIWISVDQGGNKGHNTAAEIYIKTDNSNEPQFIYTFKHTEPVTDYRKTQCYKVAEYVAEKISQRYHMKWEYKLSIDTEKSRKHVYRGLFIIIVIWIFLIVTFLLENSK